MKKYVYSFTLESTLPYQEIRDLMDTIESETIEKTNLDILRWCASTLEELPETNI